MKYIFCICFLGSEGSTLTKISLPLTEIGGCDCMHSFAKEAHANASSCAHWALFDERASPFFDSMELKFFSDFDGVVGRVILPRGILTPVRSPQNLSFVNEYLKTWSRWGEWRGPPFAGYGFQQAHGPDVCDQGGEGRRAHPELRPPHALQLQTVLLWYAQTERLKGAQGTPPRHRVRRVHLSSLQVRKHQ